VSSALHCNSSALEIWAGSMRDRRLEYRGSAMKIALFALALTVLSGGAYALCFFC
jgi:hypothetical protein